MSSVASGWAPQPPASSARDRHQDRRTPTGGQGVDHRARARAGPPPTSRTPPPGPAPTVRRGPSRGRGAPPPTPRSRRAPSPAESLTDSSRPVSVSAPEEPEFEMLRTAADGGRDLLGVGGGQHEHDVGGRLLQRLEQRVGRRRREHVHLVDDVDLPAPRCAEPGVGHQVAHGVDAVVGRRVELVHVHGVARGDLHARRAHAAGLTVDRRLAVERLGQDAGRRRLAGAPRTAEEVGVRDPAVAHGALQRAHDVVLSPQLAESARPVSAGRGRRRGRRPCRPSLPMGSDRTSRCSVRRPG